jgi:hypothetical protein
MSNIANYIKKFCDDNDYRYVDDYSGRFMYGKTCVGVIGDFSPEATKIAIVDYLTYSCPNSVPKFLYPKVDNMGLDYIVYFEDISSETFNRVAEIDKILDSDTLSTELRNLLEKKNVIYSREYATTPSMNCPCCNNTLLTDFPKFCTDCGARLHYRNSEEDL